MARRLSKKTREHLAKARESCLAAVAAYNNPTAQFRSGSYIVLMIVAWTSLFHAIAYQKGHKPWVIRTGTGRGIRYKRIGTDYRHWSLTDCMKFYFGTADNGTRANLRFLIGLRDRIEHRDMPELDAEVFGECQAALINFERLLVSEFGDRFALNTSLAWTLQFSETSPAERGRALEQIRRRASDSVVSYVHQFRSELSLDIASDQQFSFKVFLVPQLANHRSQDTLAVEFVHFDPSDPVSMEDYQSAVVLLKERHVAVRNPASLLPKAVVQRVARRLPWEFKMHHHTQCWRFFEVRPPQDADDPEVTDTELCQWDEAFRAYVYTDGWVEKLVHELGDPEKFEEVTQAPPIRRISDAA